MRCGTKKAKMKVLVVGGGFAAMEVVRELRYQPGARRAKDVEVTVVSSRNFFEFIPSALRCMVEPEHAEEACQPLEAVFGLPNVRIVVDKVESVTASHAKLASSEEQIPFDYCVIATGMSYESPMHAPNDGSVVHIADRRANLQAFKDHLQLSQSVLIVGGGVTGVELAAEVIETFPDKMVTLVHSYGRLLLGLPERAAKHAESYLRRKRVRVVLGHKAVHVEGGQYRLDAASKETAGESGEMILPDIVVHCIGGKPNSFLVDASHRNSRGFIQVDSHLAVQGMFNRVFAAGDVATAGGEHAFFAEHQARIVAMNIVRLMQRSERKTKHEPPLVSYPKDVFRLDYEPLVAAISLGKYDGSFIVGNLVINGLLAGAGKSVFEYLYLKYSARKGLLARVIPAVLTAVNFILPMLSSPPAKA